MANRWLPSLMTATVTFFTPLGMASPEIPPEPEMIPQPFIDGRMQPGGGRVLPYDAKNPNAQNLFNSVFLQNWIGEKFNFRYDLNQAQWYHSDLPAHHKQVTIPAHPNTRAVIAEILGGENNNLLVLNPWRANSPIDRLAMVDGAPALLEQNSEYGILLQPEIENGNFTGRYLLLAQARMFAVNPAPPNGQPQFSFSVASMVNAAAEMAGFVTSSQKRAGEIPGRLLVLDPKSLCLDPNAAPNGAAFVAGWIYPVSDSKDAMAIAARAARVIYERGFQNTGLTELVKNGINTDGLLKTINAWPRLDWPGQDPKRAIPVLPADVWPELPDGQLPPTTKLGLLWRRGVRVERV